MPVKLYMVLEHFAPGAKKKIYERLRQNGRMLPDGLRYVDSWLAKSEEKCFQLMETDDPALFDIWIENWKDFGRIEVFEIDMDAEKHA